ncbi:YheU family protein [Agaribacter flavus]|uniref:YheU family protein n=1 Tax=Agaribacter flavus TaxID=1902781 RepID=A0ABV7FVX3_9ALTE
MIIPYDSLEKTTLINVIESFVLREGTDYGDVEKTLEEKVEDVYRQLKAGEVFIQYSEEFDSVNIVFKDHLQK